MDGFPTILSYQIWDTPGQEGPRQVNCPEVIFYRTVQFAKYHKFPYIWIDQECFNQKSSDDVEKVLKIMHRVYRHSFFTAAMLSTTAPQEHDLKAFLELFKGYFLEPPDDYGNPWIEKCFGLLQSLSQDEWFSRLWTYHEKWCGNAVQLLIPLTAGDNAGSICPHNIVGTDPCVRIVERPHGILHGLRKCSFSDSYVVQMEALVSKVWKEHYNVLYVPTKHRLPHVEKQMRTCQSTVVADSLTILANVMSYQQRLNSNKSNEERYSLSICIFSLYLMQRWRSQTARKELFASQNIDDIMKGDLSLVIGEIMRRVIEGRLPVADIRCEAED